MSGLNSVQQSAIETLDGPILIVAGAGSGKTRVLTHRIVTLIDQRKARPYEILAVTFTNKAAREMKERIEKLLELNSYNLWVNTFHSTCVKILRNDIEALGGYDSSFVIYDDQDQLSFLKRCMKRLNIDPNNLNPKAIQNKINQAKNKGWGPETFLKHAISSYDEKAGEIYTVYQEEIKKANAVDFGDLLMLVVDLFDRNPKILEKYQRQFKYVLVDEYQDTNHVQYLLVKQLVAVHKNLCVVGDEDQSIYSWRGADISNILSFEKDFPNAKVVKLEQNYRSTKNIIEASSSLISNNMSRKPKKLWTDNDEGPLIHAVTTEDEYHEARYIAGEVLKSIQTGGMLSDFSIFYRTNAQSRVFEDIFRQNSIAYQIYGGIRFYSRSEVKDVLGYFRLILNPKDDVSFLRVINTPARGIGKVTVEKISMAAFQNNISFFESAKLLAQGNILNKGTTTKLKKFITLMNGLVKHQKKSLKELYHLVLDETQYVRVLKEDGSHEALNRVENLEELDAAIGEFQKRNPTGNLNLYLEEISLISDIDKMQETDECVKMMSLHSAKGLEFPSVFVVGLEEGLFPHAKVEWDPSEMEEERRLCYVGMTRAKENLYMTHARLRRVHGQPQYNMPSRFYDEVPPEYFQTVDLRRKAPKKGFHTETRSLNDADPIYDDDFNQESSNAFKNGMRLKHPAFGKGIICRVEGQQESTKVTIKFESGSVKKFLAFQTPFEQM